MSARRKLFGVAVLAAVAAAAGTFTWSALVGTSTNNANTASTGSVNLSDNDTGNALVTLSQALPGASDTGCIKVTYGGTLAAGVRLYGNTGGSGLDQYLDLEITRGTYTAPEPSFDSCTNFQPDGTNYVGAGNGVIYNGTLQNFPDTWAAGLEDPVAGSPATWNGGDAHVYRIRVTLQNNTAAQSLNATQSFTWQARNQ